MTQGEIYRLKHIVDSASVLFQGQPQQRRGGACHAKLKVGRHSDEMEGCVWLRGPAPSLEFKKGETDSVLLLAFVPPLLSLPANAFCTPLTTTPSPLHSLQVRYCILRHSLLPQLAHSTFDKHLHSH